MKRYRRRYFGIPRHPISDKVWSDKERCGTTGVVPGEYVSLENFYRYALTPYRMKDTKYNIYTVDSNSKWTLVKEEV